MIRGFVAIVLFAAALPRFAPVRVVGAEGPLRAALLQFRGMHTEHAYVWTWQDRVVILTQFPLSKEYHEEAGVDLKWAPWRNVAFVPPESLPGDQELQRVARAADYLVIVQAPDSAECVVNRVAGAEIRGKYGLDQVGRSEVVSCAEAGARAAKFGASSDFVAQISEVLKHPRPANPASTKGEPRRDAGAQ